MVCQFTFEVSTDWIGAAATGMFRSDSVVRSTSLPRIGSDGVGLSVSSIAAVVRFSTTNDAAPVDGAPSGMVGVCCGGPGVMPSTSSAPYVETVETYGLKDTRPPIGEMATPPDDEELEVW